jgi:hypothetical protein
MKNKEKTFSDKIEELKGKPGTIELSDKDRNGFIEGADKSIYKEHKEMDNFIWLFLGVGIGILGNFVVMLLYDWLKNLERATFIAISILFTILFFMLCYLVWDKILEHKRNIYSIIEMRKMWKKAKSINLGPAMRAYEEDELDELKKDIKEGKYNY